MTPPDASIVPGPGAPAPGPAGRPQRGAPRVFAEPVEAWITAGADHWWRVELAGLPPIARAEDRRRAVTRIRNSWMREIRRRQDDGTLAADVRYISRFVDEDGTDYFTWGPPLDSDS